MLKKSSALNSVCYIAGWFWCMFWGARGHPHLALLGAIILIALQLWFTRIHHIIDFYQDAVVIIATTLTGPFLEAIFLSLGLFQYTHNDSITPPIWIVILYPLFSLLFNHSLYFVLQNRLLAMGLGFLLAPLSYYGAHLLKALHWETSIPIALFFIGIGWSLYLGLMSYFVVLLEKAAEETFEDAKKGGSYRLLYDSACPLCSQEIHYLKKKNLQEQIHFVDIASKDFSPEQNNDVTFKQAMNRIHVIDSSGHTLTGLDALTVTYARAHLYLASILMRLPFFRPILKWLYEKFAKYRLKLNKRNLEK